MYKNPTMIKLFKTMVKNELVNTIQNGVDNLKAQPEIYKDFNMEVIDKIEGNLYEFSKATNSIQEEKFLSSLVNSFKEFINTNENFTEKRRMEDVLNMIEKVVKFFNDRMEQLLSDDTKDTEEEISGEEEKEKDNISNNSTTIELEKAKTNNGPFFTTPIILIISGCSLIIFSIFIYKCVISRKRINKNDIESTASDV